MNNVRKFITRPEGSAACYVVIGFLFSFYTIHYSLLGAIIYSLFVGFFVGYLPARKLVNANDYFIRNIQQDRYDVTRRFRKLLKQDRLPEGKTEHSEFLEFLDATEKKHAKNGTNKIAFPIISIAFFALMISIDKQLTPLNGIFLLITLFITTSYINNRSMPQKIAALREKLDATVLQ